MSNSKPLSEMSPTEIAAVEGDPILRQPNHERAPLDMDAGDSELLTDASNPRLNPDSDPYEERSAPTR